MGAILGGQGRLEFKLLQTSSAGLLAIASGRSCNVDCSWGLPCFSLEERVDHRANCKQQVREKGKESLIP